jgi:hypothetical protein
MATTEPLGYDVDAKQLTCGQCGQPVTGVLVPVAGRERPRAWPVSEVIVDVMVQNEPTTLHPCGHPYETDLSARLGEARTER